MYLLILLLFFGEGESSRVTSVKLESYASENECDLAGAVIQKANPTEIDRYIENACAGKPRCMVGPFFPNPYELTQVRHLCLAVAAP